LLFTFVPVIALEKGSERIASFDHLPHARHDEEGGLANCFKGTKKRADNDQVCEGRGRSVKSENGTPNHDTAAEEFAKWHTLNQPVDGIFHDQDGDVDTSSEPWEQLGAHEVVIFLETHLYAISTIPEERSDCVRNTYDTCEGHSTLVERLEEVGEYHDSQHALVD
jgi:hypothetical protein